MEYSTYATVTHFAVCTAVSWASNKYVKLCCFSRPTLSCRTDTSYMYGAAANRHILLYHLRHLRSVLFRSKKDESSEALAVSHSSLLERLEMFSRKQRPFTALFGCDELPKHFLLEFFMQMSDTINTETFFPPLSSPFIWLVIELWYKYTGSCLVFLLLGVVLIGVNLFQSVTLFTRSSQENDYFK